MLPIEPLKRFGQNYLQDPNILNKIAEEISASPDDVILEIGPGLGSLTEKIFSIPKSYYGVEIDKRVSDLLNEKFPTIKIFSEDFLEFDLKNIFNEAGKKFRVIGNIPYNITSPIVFKLLESRKYLEDAVLMTQYEVAKRFNGKKGTKDYGILSVILSYFTEVKYCFKISRNVFYPRPNVDSALSRLFFDKKLDEEVDDKIFIQTVKAAFGNRRKTLKNSLNNSIFRSCDFRNSPVDLTKRAEQLDREEFILLTKFIQKEFHA